MEELTLVIQGMEKHMRVEANIDELKKLLTDTLLMNEQFAEVRMLTAMDGPRRSFVDAERVVAIIPGNVI